MRYIWDFQDTAQDGVQIPDVCSAPEEPVDERSEEPSGKSSKEAPVVQLRHDVTYENIVSMGIASRL